MLSYSIITSRKTSPESTGELSIHLPAEIASIPRRHVSDFLIYSSIVALFDQYFKSNKLQLQRVSLKQDSAFDVATGCPVGCILTPSPIVRSFSVYRVGQCFTGALFLHGTCKQMLLFIVFRRMFEFKQDLRTRTADSSVPSGACWRNRQVATYQRRLHRFICDMLVGVCSNICQDFDWCRRCTTQESGCVMRFGSKGCVFISSFNESVQWVYFTSPGQMYSVPISQPSYCMIIEVIQHKTAYFVEY